MRIPVLARYRSWLDSLDLLDLCCWLVALIAFYAVPLRWLFSALDALK